MAAAIQRIFLGWDTPALHSAAQLLADHYAADDQLAMADVIVAMPGSRAGRRLLELLLSHADARALRLAPPRIMTTGALPELLYESTQPNADALTMRLAWSLALKQLPTGELARLMTGRPPDDDAAAWDAIGQLIGQLHDDLSAEDLHFADVPDLAQAAVDFADADRWTALAHVQQIYRKILQDAGRIDLQDARCRAIAEHQCRCDNDLWLIGIAEMTGQLRRMIHVADVNVRILVHAPQSLADRFDELGTARVDSWRSAHVELNDTHLSIAARPSDQASEALRRIGDLDAAYAAEQITIGVCDHQLAPYLHQQLDAFGVPVRFADGLPMPRTAVYRLLHAVAEFLTDCRFSQFAAMIRHPDVTNWLLVNVPDADHAFKATEDWADLLDRYYNDHLQARLSDHWLGEGDQRDRMADLWRLVQGNLLVDFSRSLFLREWAHVILKFLLDVFGERPLDRRDPAARLTLESIQHVVDLLQSLTQLPESLDQSHPASHALGIVLRQLADKAVPPEPLDPAVEMLGWLELHLDDADALIVTGFNEGSLPQSVNAHAFLPDSLRTALGLMNNDRRYARDCYQMSAILHSRPVARWISGRQSAQGDPLTPSRLMFASDPQTVAQRVLRFYRDDPDITLPVESASSAVRSGFTLPPQTKLGLPWTRNYLSVSDFRAYLDDPYRFALSRILKLQDIDDEASEMDALVFGQLAHEVLADFGRSDLISSNDNKIIAKYLVSKLDQLVGLKFGSDPQPAVRIQLAQLQVRLVAFAIAQALWARDGWTIHCVEKEFTGEQVPFIVDGQPMFLHGRIDRIDYNPDKKLWAIFDYKTSDSGDRPEKSHQSGRKNAKRWIDLQLPLYRRLFASMVDADGKPLIAPDAIDDPQRLQLGYILLPRDVSKVDFAVAPWSANDLHSADDAAGNIVRDIRKGLFEFDPDRRIQFPRFDPFAELCGSDQLTDDDDANEEGSES